MKWRRRMTREMEERRSVVGVMCGLAEDDTNDGETIIVSRSLVAVQAIVRDVIGRQSCSSH